MDRLASGSGPTSPCVEVACAGGGSPALPCMVVAWAGGPASACAPAAHVAGCHGKVRSFSSKKWVIGILAVATSVS